LTPSQECPILQGQTRIHLMKDEYLTRCVVDPIKRTVYLYSNEGTEKQVTCDTVDEFMNVLEFVRATVDEETLSYANPL
jgi:hypothetical protein